MSTGTTKTLRAVAGGDKGYAAVGVGGEAVVSADGTGWVHVATPTDLTLRAIARNGSAWVAVGGGGVMLRSVDGITWTAVESGTTAELLAVAPVNGTSGFVVLGEPGHGLRSTDGGATWTRL